MAPRKAKPRLCEIETLNADVEIDLDDALKRLTAAAPEKSTKANSKSDNTHSADDGSAWTKLLTNIANGKDLHEDHVNGLTKTRTSLSDAVKLQQIFADPRNKNLDASHTAGLAFRWYVRHWQRPEAAIA